VLNETLCSRGQGSEPSDADGQAPFCPRVSQPHDIDAHGATVALGRDLGHDPNACAGLDHSTNRLEGGDAGPDVQGRTKPLCGKRPGGISPIRPRTWEPILSPVVGAITGLTTAATGVFVIPAVPDLQVIGFEKEELVQALGLSFTVSTIALAFNVALEGGLKLAMANDTFVALVLACAGMWIGQAIRQRMSPRTFQRWFLIGLFLLGLYLMARSVA
jgi:sulfite exporter TauE/SafE